MHSAPAVRRALLDWHDPATRGLPWRRDPTPWGVLVSEVMAQQTQAERVGPRWADLMARYPSPAAMADAPRADVIAVWQGLGYNRRAVNLHRCAKAIVDRHAGEVPDTLAALQDLPGIGPYTARAVLVFAHDRDEAPVDTNVARVLARALAGRPLDRRAVQALADEVRPPAAAAAWTAALMDLGATTCRARRPACGGCPLVAHCRWRAVGGPDPAAAGAHRPRAQGAWEGSARQARGRLVRALLTRPLPLAEARAVLGGDAQRRLSDLVAEGLVEVDGTHARLPAGDGVDGRTGPG